MPILILLLIVVALVFGPLATIASLNLLFGLSIPFTFWTWLAVLWLSAFICGNPNSGSK